MGFLTKDQLSNPKPLYREVVDLPPPYEGQAIIRMMSGEDRDRCDNMLDANRTGPRIDWIGMRAKLVASCLCDENGNLLFQNDVEVIALNKNENALIQFLYEQCRRVNRMDVPSIEAEIKNSSTPPDADTG